MLIVSADGYNASRVGLVVALPLTSRVRPVQGRVLVRPPEGGLKVVSDILCPQIRALAHDRLLRRWGAVAPATLVTVENTLRALLHL